MLEYQASTDLSSNLSPGLEVIIMNKAALKKLVAEYLQKGRADYDVGRLTYAAHDYTDLEAIEIGYKDKLDEVHICEFCQRAYEPEEVNGVRKLKEFKGYTVDLRLQEFREMEYGKLLQIIPFDSLEGQALLTLMHKEVTR